MASVEKQFVILADDISPYLQMLLAIRTPPLECIMQQDTGHVLKRFASLNVNVLKPF